MKLTAKQQETLSVLIRLAPVQIADLAAELGLSYVAAHKRLATLAKLGLAEQAWMPQWGTRALDWYATEKAAEYGSDRL